MRSSPLVVRALAVLVVVASACTSERGAPPRQSPPVSSAPWPSPARSPSAPSPRFDAMRALGHVEAIVRVGPREPTSDAYAEAAMKVGSSLDEDGYRTRLQRFSVPAGTVDGTPVREGSTWNLVAEPRGFDPRKPFVVVGGHLDSVPDSPGANDNASGIGVMLELARVWRAQPRTGQVVFVALGAEERRRQSASRSVYALGARAYLRSLPRRHAMSAFVNLDMVGAGSRVYLVGPDRAPRRAAVATAVRTRIPFDVRRSIRNGFSDHVVFEAAGIPSVWLWAGEHRTLHTPADTMSVIRRAQLRRVGRVALGTVRVLAAVR